VDEIKPRNLGDEEYVIEGIRAVTRIIVRAVLDELPPVPVQNQDQESPKPDPEKVSYTPAKRGLVSAQTLSDILGVPRSSIWRLAREGTIPCIRIGRNLRFDKQAVMGVLNASSD
jgi:excisionase family DNA binding protein